MERVAHLSDKFAGDTFPVTLNVTVQNRQLSDAFVSSVLQDHKGLLALNLNEGQTHVDSDNGKVTIWMDTGGLAAGVYKGMVRLSWDDGVSRVIGSYQFTLKPGG